MSTALPPGSLRLAELVASLSLATDLGTGQPMDHALRVCHLSTELGSQLGMDDQECADIFYISLLRAIGCVSDAHLIAQRFGDELLAYAHIALMDVTQPREMLDLLLRHVGQGQPVLRRARMIGAALAAGPGERNETIRAHCEVAERLARRLGMREEVAIGVGQVYERWDGKGSPGQRQGEQIMRAARVVILARDAELFSRVDGPESAARMIRERSGTFYDPEVAERFCRDTRSLLRLLDTDAWEAVLAAEPGPRPVLMPTMRDRATRAIADFVDLKSPFTTGHSSGVARLAEAAGLSLGFSETDASVLRQAAYLHDLGRVAISARIWETAGPLTASDWEQVRLHPYYTERILARAPSLAGVASIAAQHHERLDGSGYFRGVPGTMLSMPTRLLAAADVYHAMVERRPHRPAHTPEEAAAQLQQELRAGRLDPDAVNAVLSAAGHQNSQVRRVWPMGLSDREVEVLQLVVDGLTNREMGSRLGISQKTVGHHIQHIYNKVGVSTRAAATLFAMQHDLLIDPPIAGA
ncbi:MAG: HD domain-containing phosphohydrolase [Nitrolancea sp.]